MIHPFPIDLTFPYMEAYSIFFAFNNFMDVLDAELNIQEHNMIFTQPIFK